MTLFERVAVVLAVGTMIIFTCVFKLEADRTAILEERKIQAMVEQAISVVNIERLLKERAEREERK